MFGPLKLLEDELSVVSVSRCDMSLRAFWLKRLQTSRQHILNAQVSRKVNTYAAVIRSRSSGLQARHQAETHPQSKPFRSPSRPPARLCPAPSAPEPSWKQSSPWRRGNASFLTEQTRRAWRRWAVFRSFGLWRSLQPRLDQSFRSLEGIRTVTE